MWRQNTLWPLANVMMFNERIILSVNDGGAIATDIQFNHPHIVEISLGKMTLAKMAFIQHTQGNDCAAQ